MKWNIIIFLAFLLFSIFIIMKLIQYFMYFEIITECISIKSDQHRREDLLKHFELIDFKSRIQFFDAITKDVICKRKYKDYIDILTNERIGRLGCWLSHIAVWKKYINYKHPVLVIEDDVRFKHDINKKLKKILKYLENTNINWDFCFIGRDEHFDESCSNIDLGVCDLEMIKKNFYQMHCYLVNCKNIPKLLKLCEVTNVDLDTFKENTAIDVYIPTLMKKNKLTLLGVKNQLAHQVSSEQYGSNTG